MKKQKSKYRGKVELKDVQLIKDKNIKQILNNVKVSQSGIGYITDGFVRVSYKDPTITGAKLVSNIEVHIGEAYQNSFWVHTCVPKYLKVGDTVYVVTNRHFNNDLVLKGTVTKVPYDDPEHRWADECK